MLRNILGILLMVLSLMGVIDAKEVLIPPSVASGDITSNEAVIWARNNYNSRMLIDYGFDNLFANSKRIHGPTLISENSYTGKVLLKDLPSDTKVFYRIYFQNLRKEHILEGPVSGTFKTAPYNKKTNIKFVWSGDMIGQGWGINSYMGGMKIFKTMSNSMPDFFIHSGDYIYADNPIQPQVKLKSGAKWINTITNSKTKVAESLEDFYGNYAYNLIDSNFRKFISEVPQYVQWDDHETLNNWYPGEILNDIRYTEKSVNVLAARSKKAFFDYTPIKENPSDPDRIYRLFHYGPSLDIFMLDMRSYRGPNSENMQPKQTDATVFLGKDQLTWLKKGLSSSKATWKIIAASMPIGVIIPDEEGTYEGIANSDGTPLGRELEIAHLLSFIRDNNIKNIVFLTADIHYTAAHYYEPEKAVFKDFLPFWEFVSGPLHAGTFGPNKLDNTFAPKVMFQKTPEKGNSNLPPSDGLQFFGEVNINGDTDTMAVSLKDVYGKTLYKTSIKPE